MKKILIAGGTGFIGQHLIKCWQDKDISIVSRQNTNPLAKISKVYSWEDIHTHGPEICKEQDLIINLTGENISSGRWNETRKKSIIDSRIDSTTLFTTICQTLENQAPPLFNASAVGIYDLQDADHLAYTEDSFIDFDATPSFLAKIARAWEKATWTSSTNLRIVNLRFGIVFGKNGGALTKMALPFKLGLGGTIGTGEQMISWIHINDLIAAIEFIYAHPSLMGPINMVAPEAVPQKVFAKTLGEILHRPTFIKTPAIMLKLTFGEMAEELLLKGQHVYPKKLIDAGFQFHYGKLEDALREIFLFSSN